MHNCLDFFLIEGTNTIINNIKGTDNQTRIKRHMIAKEYSLEHFPTTDFYYRNFLNLFLKNQLFYQNLKLRL